MPKYYLVLDKECPGSEHDSWDEAINALRKVEEVYGRLPDARILRSDKDYDFDLWD